MSASYEHLAKTCIELCIAVSSKEDALNLLSMIRDTCNQERESNEYGTDNGASVLSEDETFCRHFNAMGEKWGDDPNFAVEFSSTTHCFHNSYNRDSGFGNEVADMRMGPVLMRNLQIHRNRPDILKQLCESLLIHLNDYNLPMQDDLGKGGGCVIVTSILQQYMNDMEMVKILTELMYSLVCTEAEFYVAKNYKRFNKAGACEVIVQVLQKYMHQTDTGIPVYAVQTIADMCWACPRNQDRYLKIGACALIVEAAENGCIDCVNDAIAGMGRKCAQVYRTLGALKLLEAKPLVERNRFKAAITYLKDTEDNEPAPPGLEEAVRSDTSYDGEDDVFNSEEDEDYFAMDEMEEDEPC